MTIQQLSQEVGVSIDTLRVWERRYGTPDPQRDSRGHRSYNARHLEQLRQVKKLLDLGYRPGKIFTMSDDERRRCLERMLAHSSPEDDGLQELIINAAPERIDQEMRRRFETLGLETFVRSFAVPLLRYLDHGWTEGNISIAREHLISYRLEQLLREQLSSGRMDDAPRPKLLFLTLNGERHTLGLLLAAVLFRQAGVDCLVINEELPISEVPQLVIDLSAAGIALSFSAHYSTRQAKQDLALLRNSLEPGIKMIAGGFAVHRGVRMLNVTICCDLNDIPDVSRKMFPVLAASA